MYKIGLLLLSLHLVPLSQAHAQRGCTDARASNFNPVAVVNDGSCQYAATATTLQVRAQLPSDVSETSGLQYTDGTLWTFNDSGNEPLLFRLNPDNGTILQRVRIRNFANVDWEDIAADAQYLYVGDFGNNAGNRTDLRVLRVQKAAIGSAAEETVTAEAINFRFPDQTTFGAGYNDHNFDCEAMFYAQDSLHIFTKNWADFKTKYYTVPATPGTYVARLRTTFNVNGLITAADVSATGAEAYLVGYNQNNGTTFLWLLFDYQGSNFFAGNKRRLELPNALLVGQVEGVSVSSPGHLYLSNEQLAVSVLTVPPRLYTLATSQWTAATVTPAASAGRATGFSVSPNPASQMLWVQRETAPSAAVYLRLQDARGREVAAAALLPGQKRQGISVAALPTGVYVLTIATEKGRSQQKVMVP